MCLNTPPPPPPHPHPRQAWGGTGPSSAFNPLGILDSLCENSYLQKVKIQLARKRGEFKKQQVNITSFTECQGPGKYLTRPTPLPLLCRQNTEGQAEKVCPRLKLCSQRTGEPEYKPTSQQFLLPSILSSLSLTSSPLKTITLLNYNLQTTMVTH